MRRFIEPILLSAGGLLVAWLLIEITLRAGATAFPYAITAPMRDVKRHPFSSEKILPEQIWRDDDSYQLVTPPGIDSEFHYPDPRIGLTITTKNWLDPNSKVGFRVPDPAWEPAWPVDAVVVGDSFTFCYVNDYENCWVDLLVTEHNFSTVNLGLVATGSISHQNVLNTFGLAHQPKVVIWQWYGNDFNDDYGFTTLYGEEATERKGEDTVPPGWLRQNSAVASIIYAFSQAQQGSKQYAQFADPYGIEIGAKTFRFGRPYMQEAFSLESQKNQEGVALTQQAISETNTRLAEAGIKLIIVLIPTKEVVYAKWTAAELSAAELDELSAGRLEMLSFCQINNLNCIDATQPLTDQANKGILVYHAQDTHLNSAGNRVLADFMAQELNSILSD